MGVVDSGSEVFDFLFEEETGVDGQMMLDGISGSVGAVDDGETILDEEIGAYRSCDICDKIRVVGFFARIETEVV